jgi:hypothetical protein
MQGLDHYERTTALLDAKTPVRVTCSLFFPGKAVCKPRMQSFVNFAYDYFVHPARQPQEFVERPFQFPELLAIVRILLKTISIFLIVTGALLLSEKPAYAYADPGTGLLAIQAAGSGLIALGWYLRRKVYLLFHRGAESTQKADETSAANQDLDSSLQ